MLNFTSERQIENFNKLNSLMKLRKAYLLSAC